MLLHVAAVLTLIIMDFCWSQTRPWGQCVLLLAAGWIGQVGRRASKTDKEDGACHRQACNVFGSTTLHSSVVLPGRSVPVTEQAKEAPTIAIVTKGIGRNINQAYSNSNVLFACFIDTGAA